MYSVSAAPCRMAHGCSLPPFPHSQRASIKSAYIPLCVCVRPVHRVVRRQRRVSRGAVLNGLLVIALLFVSVDTSVALHGSFCRGKVLRLHARITPQCLVLCRGSPQPRGPPSTLRPTLLFSVRQKRSALAVLVLSITCVQCHSQCTHPNAILRPLHRRFVCAVLQTTMWVHSLLNTR